MTKRLSAVVGEYINKENQPKAEWVNIGIIGIGKNNKEYVLLDPTINLAGILLKQNVLAQKRNEAPSDMIMASIFEEQQNQGQQNNNQQQGQQQGQGNFQQNNNQGYPQQGQGGGFQSNNQQ